MVARQPKEREPHTGKIWSEDVVDSATGMDTSAPNPLTELLDHEAMLLSSIAALANLTSKTALARKATLERNCRRRRQRSLEHHMMSQMGKRPRSA